MSLDLRGIDDNCNVGHRCIVEKPHEVCATRMDPNLFGSRNPIPVLGHKNLENLSCCQRHCGVGNHSLDPTARVLRIRLKCNDLSRRKTD